MRKNINKRQKGFTLVEMIAVVAVLAVIMLMSYPTFLGIIKNNKEGKYTQFLDVVCSAGDYYAFVLNESLGNSLSASGKSIDICLNDLNTAGLIKKSMVDPKSNKAIDLSSTLVVTVKSNGTHSCKIEKKATCTTKAN